MAVNRQYAIGICALVAISVLLVSFTYSGGSQTTSVVEKPCRTTRVVPRDNEKEEQERLEVLEFNIWKAGVEVAKADTKPPSLYATPSAKSKCKNSIGQNVKDVGMFAPAESIIVYNLLKDKCNDGNTMVYDVGANIGFYAIWMANMGCNVHAFDPSVWNMEHLRISRLVNNIPMNQLQLHTVAVGEKEETVFLNFRCDQSGFSSVSGSQSKNQPPVNKITLDNFMVDNPEVPYYIKIDTEGYEHLVFAGAKKLITMGVNTIVCEFKMHIEGAKKLKFMEDFLKAGYHLYSYSEGYGGKVNSWDLKSLKPRKVTSPITKIPWEDIVITKNERIIQAWG